MGKNDDIIARDRKVASPSMTRDIPLVFDHGKGPYIFDAEGKKFLDFGSCLAVLSVGHSNPAIIRAVKKQLAKGVHCAFSDYYAETPVAFCEKLIGMLPGYGKVFLSSSGTESVEAAYKLARWHTKKKWAISFHGSFHGRTMGSLSLTDSKKVQRERYGPFLAVAHSPYPYPYKMKMEPEECSQYCLSELEKTMKPVKDDLAAVFIEPVLGEGGYVIPPASFLKGVRRLCDEYGTLLCNDEIQSGTYRTGKFLAQEHFGIMGDVLCLGKGIGSGFPIGVTISTDKVMDWVAGTHANTYGGNLISCAAAKATLECMERNRLGENAEKIGKGILGRLKEIQDGNAETVMETRGLGLMIGVEIRDPKVRERMIYSAFAKGLVLLPAGESAIRLAPPLNITKAQANAGMDIFEEAIREAGR